MPAIAPSTTPYQLASSKINTHSSANVGAKYCTANLVLSKEWSPSYKNKSTSLILVRSTSIKSQLNTLILFSPLYGRILLTKSSFVTVISISPFSAATPSFQLSTA